MEKRYPVIRNEEMTTYGTCLQKIALITGYEDRLVLTFGLTDVLAAIREITVRQHYA